jgi:methanogen extracellular protein (TIGR04279 family)
MLDEGRASLKLAIWTLHVSRSHQAMKRDIYFIIARLGFMRLAIALLIFLCLPVSMAQPGIDSIKAEIALDGGNEVIMPGASLTMPGVQWSYPYKNYPVYAPGQSISGSFNDPDSGIHAVQKIGICLVRLNTESFLETLKILARQEMPDPGDLIGMEMLDPSSRGEGRFSFKGLDPGLYAIAAADMGHREILCALPVFVAEGHISVDAPDMISLGDMGEVKIQSFGQPGNMTRKYGAVLISAEDYNASSLSIKDHSLNESPDMVSTISIGPKSAEIRGEPKISQKLIESILAVLPQDSAIALQESNSTSSDMYLITDPGWAPGKYILTCGVYTSDGIIGINQRFVELVP